MLSSADFCVIACCLFYMVILGWIFRRFAHDSSEYFRGSGRMPWWMVGASSYISGFSVWTFTGAMGLAYEWGIVVFAIFWSTALAYFFSAGLAARRYRQTRAVTIMEIVRARLGAKNEQFFTWLRLPAGLLIAGIWLYSLAIFCAPAFGIEVRTTIVGCGLAVVGLSAFGGSWAVAVGGFVQSIVLLTVGLVVAASAWFRIGGWHGLISGLPSTHWDIAGSAAGQFGPWWLGATLLDKFFAMNSVLESGKYLSVRDGGEARKAALLILILTAVGPLLWFLPAFAARAEGLDPAAIFPQLSHPAEGVYFAVAHQVLPIGLMGLVVVAVISTTLSSMDVGLNSNAGVFVRSVYLRLIRPGASDRDQVRTGRLVTIVFGLIVISLALLYSTWTHLTLFSLMLSFQALIYTPIAVPLFWSIWIRQSPDWAPSATVLLGLALGLVVATVGQWEAGCAGFRGWIAAHTYASATLADCIGCSAFYLVCSRWGAPPAGSRAQEVRSFFATVRQPVVHEQASSENSVVIRWIGRLCLAYGAGIAILALLPNPLLGRMKIALCSAILAGMGLSLTWAPRWYPRSSAERRSSDR